MSDPPTGKKFTRTIEDFLCARCGHQVAGDGYTNHCTECLWSRHVDVNPGDRQESCRGMMEPVEIIRRAGEYWILHRCVECGHERRNRSASADRFEALIALSVAPRTPHGG